MGGRLGARAARFGLTTWAVVVCAVTIVLSIGGPLVGRGVFVGVNLIRTELPWRADRPSDELYRLPPLHDTVELGVPQRTLIRDTLFDEGRIDYHPVFPGRPGYAARRIEDADDVRDVIALLRINYDRAVARHGLPGESEAA